MPKQNQQNKFLEFQILSQQLQQLQQQLHSLDHQLESLEELQENLIALKDQESSKTLSSLNGGVFVESEIKKTDYVYLSVGANVIVKKKKEEAIILVEKQVRELGEIRVRLEEELDKMNLYLNSLQ